MEVLIFHFFNVASFKMRIICSMCVKYESRDKDNECSKYKEREKHKFCQENPTSLFSFAQ